MRLIVTGAAGLVGRFVVADALAHGHEVISLGRSAVPGTRHMAWQLGEAVPALAADALIHAAFDHVPGRYRGGEGDDPAGFMERNLDGSVALFEAAKSHGIRRVVFLSSRAVFDGLPPGGWLDETTPPQPKSLYGQIKAEAEQALAALAGSGFQTTSLRMTGVYGRPHPGLPHKWQGLFTDYLNGQEVTPRQGTELSGQDFAAGLRLVLAADAPPSCLHLSDLLLDRHDLLAEVQRLTGCPYPPPERAEGPPPSQLRTACAHALGWQPSGWAGLRAALPGLVDDSTTPCRS